MSSSAIGSFEAAAGIRTVAIVLQESARALETAVVWELFGSDRTAEFFPTRPRVEFVSTKPNNTITMLGGGALSASGGPQEIAGADLIFLAPPLEVPHRDDIVLQHALRRASACGSIIAAVDTSVFTLARTGLLDDRPAATHWSLHDQFREQFPNVSLNVDARHTSFRNLHTAAGGTAVADLCLNLIESAFDGDEVANLEHHLVTSVRHSEPRSHRNVLHRAPADSGITDLLEWISANVCEDLSLDAMSAHSFMSRRSLSRRFRAATGSTPHAYVLNYRVRLARELLAESPEMTVEEVATRVGFRTAGLLRQHFRRSTGSTPTAYRESRGHLRSLA